ncbi:DoxX family protein [Limnobacter thiooxidans]|uniref:DoxX family protein n=1 Tax=Limnobacter thiooxidans TaxID=131080 RepID=A0AA86JKN8_9BURK|nr:DoxX family protein [Limnobacter thiooxidans]
MFNIPGFNLSFSAMPPIPVLVVAAFFIGAGILHFVLLDFFSSIVPPYFSNPEALVKISGIFEILGGIGILVERTRKWAGFGLIALCVAVLPANIHMAMNPDQFANIPVVLLYLRLPLQALVIWVIWKAAHSRQA